MIKIFKFGGALAATVGALLLVVDAAPVAAKPAVTTKVKYYSVPGTSSQALLSYMQRNGPNVNGSRALASASANFRYKADAVASKGCRLKNFRVSANFVITLPRATQKSKMSSGVRKRWRHFVKHARWHENHHKKIWVGCARKIERVVRSMGGQRSCNAAWAKARSIVKSELNRCDKIHAAFDRKETANAPTIPLIAQALRATQTPYARAAIKRALRHSHNRVSDVNR